MAIFIRVFGKMGYRMVEVNTNGVMVMSIMEISNRASNMEKEF
jgi:hypothetical protein